MPWAIVAALGVMSIAVNAGAVTVKVMALEVTPAKVAVTVEAPCAKLDTMPLLFKIATPALLLTHVTALVRLPMLLSEYVPTALKLTDKPFAIEIVTIEETVSEIALALMLIPVNTAAVTVRLAEDEVTLPNAAVTVVLPTATPVAIPVALLIDAIPVLADDQVTCDVMSAVEASE